MSNDEGKDSELVRIDVDNRPATVVVSVRLDSDVARDLVAFARGRGVRLSDVLRDAAKTFSERQDVARALTYRIQGATEVTVGGPAWQSNVLSFEPSNANAKTIRWGRTAVSR